MRQEMMRFWDAAASAGPYANNLHLAPERQPHQHLIAQFLQARLINPTTLVECLTDFTGGHPTNNINALKAKS